VLFEAAETAVCESDIVRVAVFPEWDAAELIFIAECHCLSTADGFFYAGFGDGVLIEFRVVVHRSMIICKYT